MSGDPNDIPMGAELLESLMRLYPKGSSAMLTVEVRVEGIPVVRAAVKNLGTPVYPRKLKHGYGYYRACYQREGKEAIGFTTTQHKLADMAEGLVHLVFSKVRQSRQFKAWLPNDCYAGNVGSDRFSIEIRINGSPIGVGIVTREGVVRPQVDPPAMVGVTVYTMSYARVWHDEVTVSVDDARGESLECVIQGLFAELKKTPEFKQWKLRVPVRE